MSTAVRYLLSDLDYGEAEEQAVLEVLRSKWLSVGPQSAEFEAEFAALVGARHAVAVSSCTAALHLALLQAGIGPGDEVLVPSYTFVASVNPILYVGAQPVFVDITGPHDLNLDPADLEARVTSRTRAILAVHLAGFPAAMGAILQLAERHGLVVIEDACHAIGARYIPIQPDAWSGRCAGTLGRAGCFSFFANKNLPTGEGGMLVTDDEALASGARRARSHGMTKTSWDKAAGRAMDYDVEQFGFNYRGTELTAALGRVQLKKLLAHNARRLQLVSHYRSRLAACEGLDIPFNQRLEDSAHHIFPVLLPRADMRPAFRQHLQQAGVQTSVHYPPVHCFSEYQRRCPQQPPLPRTIDASAREVTLPLHPLLSEADVDVICDTVAEALRVASSR